MRHTATFAFAAIGVAGVLAPLAACGLDLTGDLGPDDGGAGDVSVDARDATAEGAPIDGTTNDAEGDGAADDGNGGNDVVAIDTGVDAPPDVAVDGGPCALADGGAGVTCGGACVDPTDHDHCGGCTPCAAHAACENGACVNVAASLVAFRYEQPCTSLMRPYCATNTGLQTKTATLTGTLAKVYVLTVHVRGVVEQKTINGSLAGGATGTNAGFFVLGGTPATDGWNTYAMAVSAPSSKVFFNAGASNHDYCDPLDYHAKLSASGSATLTFTADPADAFEAANRDSTGTAIVIPGIPPAPLPYNGQFIQLDVESVRLGP